VLNAADQQMCAELSTVFVDLASDPECDIIVLTGAGRAFSAGGDIGHMERMAESPRMFAEEMPTSRRILSSLLDCEKPIIAKINGDAIGVGATIALYCDIIFADETARIADPHIRVGLVAGDGGALIWPQLIGFARAKYHLFTGDALTGAEAAAIGLVNFALPANALDGEVDAFADRLARGAQAAIRGTKVTVNLALKALVQTGLDAGMALEALSAGTSDHREAIAAFRERRSPQFGEAI
jgi:enoyl-CoA hydratase